MADLATAAGDVNGGRAENSPNTDGYGFPVTRVVAGAEGFGHFALVGTLDGIAFVDEDTSIALLTDNFVFVA